MYGKYENTELWHMETILGIYALFDRRCCQFKMIVLLIAYLY